MQQRETGVIKEILLCSAWAPMMFILGNMAAWTGSLADPVCPDLHHQLLMRQKLRHCLLHFSIVCVWINEISFTKTMKICQKYTKAHTTRGCSISVLFNWLSSWFQHLLFYPSKRCWLSSLMECTILVSCNSPGRLICVKLLVGKKQTGAMTVGREHRWAVSD